MIVDVTSGAMVTLVAQSFRGRKVETCGLLLGMDGRIDRAVATRNVHPEPERFFEIDPAALIAAHRRSRAGGRQIMGYFHSHPRGSAVPSAEDARCACGDGKIWAILAGLQIGWWRDGPLGFVRQEIRLVAPRLRKRSGAA